MQSQLQITFRNMKPLKEAEAWIREAAAKLENLFSQIMGCRVELQLPHRHHKKGRLYHVRIDLTLPGGEIVVRREPSLSSRARHLKEPELKKHAEVNTSHKDLRRTIDDAFKAAGRRLQDHARRQRGDIKRRAPLPEARVSKILPQEGYGFLTSVDGREIYFHKNSVLGGAFPHLKIGTTVRFAEERGEKGPQASTLHIVPRQGIRQATKKTAA